MTQTLFALVVLAIGPTIPQTAAAQGGAGGAPAAPAPGSTTTTAPAAPAPSAPPPAPTPPPAPAPSASPAPPPTPAPAAPADLTPSPSVMEKSAAGTAGGAGLAPTAPTIGSGSLITTKQAEALAPSTSGSADEWKFDFHGYFRAPLRISFGPPTPANLPSSQVGDKRPPGAVDPYPVGAEPPVPGTQWHSPTRVPGYNYQDWNFTNTVHGPWTQLNFSYGNSRAMATVIVNSYAVQDGGYRHLQAQQGIDQAFLTLNFPEALGDLGTLTWNIGTFQNRYGTMGKYDGGMYETYLIGRTHITGTTLTANLTNLDNAGNWQLTLEYGLGAKYDVIPFTNNQTYQIYTIPPGKDSQPYLADMNADYLPYAGSVPQGSTFLHHAHAVAKYQKLWTLGLHYIYTWTPDDNWHPENSTLPNVSDAVPRALGPIQGSIAVVGAEARFNGGVFGDGYIGYSHIDARNINALADSLEVVHSRSGYNFKQNFFGRTYDAHTGIYQGPQNETGTVDNVGLQYSFSFGALARYPEDWWGDGPDLVLTAFGLLSIVDSKAPPLALTQDPTRATTWDMSTKKLKMGFDAVYTPLYWLGFNARFDWVQPDIDAAYARTPGVSGGSEKSFEVITARLLFRTQFITHETVQLQYAHYWLGAAAYPPYPYEWVARADANMVGLFASMWW